MRIAVWIVSGLLAVAFLSIGGIKVMMPIAEMQSPDGPPVMLLKTAGVAEMIGAVGLILPAVTRIQPRLTPIAATALAVTMVGASVTEVILGNYVAVASPTVLGVLSAIVAWARFGPATIAPRRDTTSGVARADLARST